MTVETSKYYLNELDIFKTYPNKYQITHNDFAIIARTFFFVMMRRMIYEYETYKLPYGLGRMGIFKKTTYGKGVFDYKLYKEEGIKHWHKNLHTHNYVARIKLDPRWPNCIYDSIGRMIKFKANRNSSRELAKHLKENNVIYKYYDYD
jgi:hypothetical protein